ncbi:MAG: MutS-related protein [Crocinitomicaceae bacterium]
MNPIDFYQTQIQKCDLELSRLKRVLFVMGMIRLGLFLATGFAVYILMAHFTFAIVIGVVGLALFLFAVSKNEDFKHQRNRFRLLRAINEREIKLSEYNWTGEATGEEWITENHHYNQDIDLFGEGSLFQRINRTSTRSGTANLAETLNNNSKEKISKKQDAVKFMAGIPEWRQTFQTTAGLIDSEVDNKEIARLLNSYEPKIPKVFGKLWIVFSAISIAAIALYALEFISSGILLIWYLINLAITGIYLGKVTTLSNQVGKLSTLIGQYSGLLELIEELPENAPDAFLEEKNRLMTESEQASEIIAGLAKRLGQLDQRNNIFFALIANGLFMWDLRHASKIEQWLRTYKLDTVEWFSVISKFETLISFGTYAYNHPDFVYPTLIEGYDLIVAEDLGHPLIKPETRITNDFKIRNEDFYIVTGANMAGKSTFLRTIALNLVMANNGLPVCAKSYQYQPIRLISSMRTSDSLTNDESYFFSELKRLKFIVDALKKDDYFIILDEILKGTNSKDKAEGSQKFVEKLVKTKSTGLIATHDLSLCAFADQLPEVDNYYFDALIENDELSFDYILKKGICQNMNASFLLRKMEIVDA